MPFNTIHVTDPRDPRIAPFANQKDAWLRAAHRPIDPGRQLDPDDPLPPTGTGLPAGLPPDLFIAEGDKVVRQLLLSPHRTVSLLLADTRWDVVRPMLEPLADRLVDTPIYLASRDIIDSIVGFQIHRGVLACGRRTDPGPPAAIIESARTVVVMDELANHDNVGGIIRSVRALAPAPAALLLTPRCCDPLYRKAIRVSMGNVFHVPHQWFGGGDDKRDYLSRTALAWPGPALQMLTDRGFLPIGLTPAPDAVPIDDAVRMCIAETRRVALIVGPEGPGLPGVTLDAIRGAGGRLARIDIDPAADSLNAMVAVSIALERVRALTGTA